MCDKSIINHINKYNLCEHIIGLSNYIKFATVLRASTETKWTYSFKLQ